MESLPYVDALIKEYLLFRGFTKTLEIFSSEITQDIGFGYQADKMTGWLFQHLIPGLMFKQILDFLELLQSRLYIHLDSSFDVTIRKMEQSIIKCMLVTAVKKKRCDKVDAFFKEHGAELLQGPDALHWRPWCALSFVEEPWRDPEFQAHFFTEWEQLLQSSFCNLLTTVTSRLPLPALLHFNTDRRIRLQLSRQVEQLKMEMAQQKLDNSLDLENQARQQAAGGCISPGHCTAPVKSPGSFEVEGLSQDTNIEGPIIETLNTSENGLCSKLATTSNQEWQPQSQHPKHPETNIRDRPLGEQYELSVENHNSQQRQQQ